MAEASIDKLSVEIDYEAQQATNGLKNLKQTLESFQSSLPQISSNFGNVNKAINTLTKRVNSLNTIDTSAFSKKMVSIGTSIESLKGVEVGNLRKVFNQLKSIPDINDKLDDKTIEDFTKKINTLSAALTPLATNLTKVGNVLNTLPSKLNKVSNYTSKSQENFSALDRISNTLNFGAVAYTAQRVGDALAGFIDSSNKYVEDLNLFTVSMGESTEAAEEWINTVSTALGLDPSGMMRNMGVFNIMAEGFGVASDKAYIMSKNLTQLVYDFSSFYNLNFEESANKVRSALAGKMICLIYKKLYMITLLISGTPKRVMA